MSDVICIYHGNCADGFTAAWVVYKTMKERGDERTIEFFPGIYGEPPPNVTGKDVIIVDFSYKRPILADMLLKANSFLILDHHKTAAKDLEEFPFSVFDMERSGAGITWDYFHPGKPRPLLVNYVEDRDLWRFKLMASREANAFIFAHEYDFKQWDTLAWMFEQPNAIMTNISAAGAAIETKHHKDVKELVAVCRRRMKIADVEVWGASIPYTLTSDAGNLMSKDEPFAACYWDVPGKRIFSLRSSGPEAWDVSEIAKAYGGGGHKNAAGFAVPLSEIGQFEL